MIDDTLIEEFDISNFKKGASPQNSPVTVWVPVDIKNKYLEIQRLTHYEFSKYVKKILIATIEKVKLDK